MLRTLLHNPKRLWIRRAFFQIHLWAGIILGLYIVIIGVTGSMLVFQDELVLLSYPTYTRSANVGKPWAEPALVVEKMHAKYPQHTLHAVYSPLVRTENYVGLLTDKRGALYVFADPHTGEVTADFNPLKSWIAVVQQLHINLLAGRTGRIANGVGGICLVALCLTGLVIWWPGVKHWVRGLKVNFRMRWTRINYDLHSAVGIWTLLFTMIWGVTGIYFAWPVPFTNAIRAVLPTQPALGKIEPPKRPKGTPLVPLQSLVDSARRSTPGGRVLYINLAHDDDDPVTINMGRGAMNNFVHADFYFYDPASGKQLAQRKSGYDGAAGDIAIALLGPIHFGTQWGMTVKVLWGVFGLSLPLLAVTGTLMYWNRWLGKRWKKWRTRSRHREVERTAVRVRSSA